jgi:transglutaminase-like putative cysteine protease
MRLNPGRLLTALLLLVLITSLARSVEAARWTEGLGVLLPISVLGTIVGVALAVSRLSAVKAHAFGALLGAGVVVWQTGRVIPPEELGEGSRVGLVWRRFTEWVGAVLDGRSSYDQLLFVFTMGAIVWFLAHNNAWFALRHSWAWPAVLPTGLVMLVNLGYAVRPDTRPFILYLLAAMLLIVQTHLARSRERWEREGLGHDRALGAKVLLAGGAVSVALLAVAWHGPSAQLALTARQAYQRVERPWNAVQERWQRAFAFLYPGGRPQNVNALGTGFTSFNESFELGGPLRQGNRVVFTATGAPRQYWRGASYDTYTGRQWSVGQGEGDEANIAVTTDRLAARAGNAPLRDGLSRVAQTVSVVTPLRSRSLFSADSPVSVNRPAVWQLAPVERERELPVLGELSAAQRAARGEELERVRRLLRQMGPAEVVRASSDGVVLRRRPQPAEQPAPQRTPGAWQRVTGEQAEARLNSVDLRAAFEAVENKGIRARYRYIRGRPAVITYSYVDANQEDVVDLTAAEPLQKGASYEVNSIVPNPTDEQLDAAPAAAPEWVRDRYMGLPDSTPARVRQLAEEVTEGARTTHQKALAIERYLRAFKYRENMPPTPANRDFVDHFLFEQREGYCTYYASAMAVMLRSLDVPTRVVAGFAPGAFDERVARYVITESNLHAWPQVYYSRYGWVNYEPTPIRDLVNRSETALDAGEGGGPGSPGRPELNEEFGLQNRAGSGALGAEQETTLPVPVRVAVTVAFFGLVAAALALLLAMYRLRGLHGAPRQYAKLVQLGSLLGAPHRASQTPGEYGVSLGATLPRAREPVGRITGEYVAEVFGRCPADRDGLPGAWRKVVVQAARSAPGRATLGLLRLDPRRWARRLRRR